LQHAVTENWQVTIGEKDTDLAKRKFPEAQVVDFDCMATESAKHTISQADLVISMIPAFLHIHVAKICVELDKDLLTASYVSKEIKALSDGFAAKGKCCIMELGLDPGNNHMSARKVLDRIKKM